MGVWRWRRLGTPEEVADVLVWLMSGEAGFVNGSVVEGLW